jgi:hypothetical protein
MYSAQNKIIKSNYGLGMAMNNKIECCPTCGASMKQFWHALSPGLVSVLIKAIQFVHKNNKNKFHYKDLDLNYTEASNLQKLRFHGLIAHFNKENKKSGEWLITKKGGRFLRGEIKTRSRVKTFRNEVVDYSKEEVGINDFKNKIPDFESNFSYEFKEVDDFPMISTLFKTTEIQIVSGTNGVPIAKRVVVKKII